jgi:hypothetical protein
MKAGGKIRGFFGKTVCKFQDPIVLQSVLRSQSADDIVVKTESCSVLVFVPCPVVSAQHTRSTMKPWTHPLRGGTSRAHLSTTLFRISRLVTSHGGALDSTTSAVSSCTNSWATLFIALERDNRSRYSAPRSTSHRAILRPIPPCPPTITYIEFIGFIKLGFVRSAVCSVSIIWVRVTLKILP